MKPRWCPAPACPTPRTTCVSACRRTRNSDLRRRDNLEARWPTLVTSHAGAQEPGHCNGGNDADDRDDDQQLDQRKALIFLALHGSVLRKRKQSTPVRSSPSRGVPRASRVLRTNPADHRSHSCLAADPRRPARSLLPAHRQPTHPQCGDNWLMIENSGRYIEMTMPPTITPSTATSAGSSIVSRPATAMSTSSS